ncbi:hypothetical protein BUALT_Bualt13G0074100 [Buddleja alternifolia]|uniref:Uncharacterized protein n=1 Tax=Buddleja alternifolia TaxID=168488 RepID=A0AAV6WS89_9LAMI|nr:hypothetical protein BUALT_Bualt13G0074100 [Buddleja alternifolia]
MSDPLLWLPPLNSHKNYFIRVHASETQIPPSELQFTKIQRPIFVINLSVTAGYSTPDQILDDVDDYGVLPILALNKTLEIDRNPKTLITSLTDDILSADLVPFQLDRCSWDIRYDDNNLPQYVYLVDEEEVYLKLFEFLCNLIENPNNAKHNILGVKLEIQKLVDVLRDEFWSWKSYYIEKKLICPRREEFITRSRRYLEAIKRPRSEIELFEETLSLMMYKPAR